MKRKYLASIIASAALGLTVLAAPTSNAILPTEGGSSDSSTSTGFAQTIGNAIERVASTMSQIVSPQPSDSSAAQKSYSAVPELMCRVSIAYVLSYTPVVNWTYQNNKLIPITTSLVVSTPIETRICS